MSEQQPEKTNHQRRRIIVTMIGLLIVAFAVVRIFFFNDPLQCDPTIRREEPKRYGVVTKRPPLSDLGITESDLAGHVNKDQNLTGLPPTEYFVPLMQDVEVEISEQRKELTFKNSNRSILKQWDQWITTSVNDIEPDLLPMDGEEYLDLKQGRIRFHSVGVVSGKKETRQTNYEFYTADGVPLAEDQLQTLASRTKTTYNPLGGSGNIYPFFQTAFVFELDQVDGFDFVDFTISYVENEYQIRRKSWMDRAIGEHYVHSTVIPVIYPTPFSIQYHCVYGPPLQKEITVDDHEFHLFEKGVIQLIDVYPWTSNSYGMGSGGLGPNLTGYKPDGKGSMIVFNTSSKYFSSHLEIEALVNTKTHDGSMELQWKRSFGNYQEGLYFLHNDFAKNDIQKIRINVLPHYSRFAVILPKVPGVEQVNANRPKNLFDLVVPVLELKYPNDFRNALENYLQLRFEGKLNVYPPPFPANYFPKSFENITVRELMIEYLTQQGIDPDEIEINEEKGTISLRQEKPGWTEEVLERTFK